MKIVFIISIFVVLLNIVFQAYEWGSTGEETFSSICGWSSALILTIVLNKVVSK